MVRTRVTSGAAAVVVVLFTLILLGALLAVSSRLSVSSFRTTSDQIATLEAQYTAESNLNYARSVLSDLQGLMGPDSLKATNTSVSEIRQAVADFCGVAAYTSVTFSGNVASSKYSYMVDGLDQDTAAAAQVCGMGTGTNQGKVLARYVDSAAYAKFLPSSEVPTDKTAFWNGLFSDPKNSLTQTGKNQFKLEPLGVLKITDTRFRFFVGVGNAAARGEKAGATRVLSGNNNVENGVWWFEMTLPNLTEWVLFTNHHRSSSTATAPNVNFVSGQIFDGPVHTNERFLFSASTVNTQFRGKVTSAGCTDATDSTGCTQRPGLLIGGTAYTPTGAASVVEGNKTIKSWLPSVGWPTENYVKEPEGMANFYADYVALPENANNQKQAAETGGLVVPSDVLRVELLAGTEAADGTLRALNTFNRLAQKWTEPANTYQYVRYYGNVAVTEYVCKFSQGYTVQDTWDNYYRRYIPNATWNNTADDKRGTAQDNYGRTRYIVYKCGNETTNQVRVTREYRIGSDTGIQYRNLQSNGTMGSWATDAAKPKFNGVIYSPDIITDLRGPERIASTVDDTSVQRVSFDEAPPALASFSKITVAAENGINISSDLTLSDTPCDNSGKLAGYPKAVDGYDCVKTASSGNVLGLFSQSGDIVFTTTAPESLNIHGILMTSEGRVRVQNYDTRAYSGKVHLVGGLVENWYGFFGTESNPRTGYLRNFTYDPRLKDGLIPPHFPVSPSWDIETPQSGDRGLANLVITSGKAGAFR